MKHIDTLLTVIGIVGMGTFVIVTIQLIAWLLMAAWETIT